MGKTYRKEKPDSKRRSETRPGTHGNKSISHERDRERKRQLLKHITENWDDEEGLLDAE